MQDTIKEFLEKSRQESSYTYPTAPYIHELIEAKVKKTPDAIAVVFQNKRLTYQDLNNRANQLASYLRSQGVQQLILLVEKSFFKWHNNCINKVKN